MNGLCMPETNGDISSHIKSNGQLPTPELSTAPSSPVVEPRADSNETDFALIPKESGHTNGVVPAIEFQDGDISRLDGAASSSLVAQNGIVEEETRKRSIGKLGSPTTGNTEQEKVLKLSPAKIQELTSSPTSVPLRAASPLPEDLSPLLESPVLPDEGKPEMFPEAGVALSSIPNARLRGRTLSGRGSITALSEEKDEGPKTSIPKHASTAHKPVRPCLSTRAVSTPVMRRKPSSTRAHGSIQEMPAQKIGHPLPLDVRGTQNDAGPGGVKSSPMSESVASPASASLPLPPLSMPTYLQLELSSDKPSPLYIHRPATADLPYESSAVKFERLLNFLLLPPQLEQVLWFGALACLDAWLYTFTILPLRFFTALGLLIQWWARNAAKETRYIASFIYSGMGRVWRRRHYQNVGVPVAAKLSRDGGQSRRDSSSLTSAPQATEHVHVNGDALHNFAEQTRKHARRATQRHRRIKSTPSSLQPTHKADILRGLLVIASCAILMRYDASRMYHSIRGQAAIKLYVIYNVLEVGDRLFSALGQDVMECLLCPETLERDADGRSKIIRPFWMFLLALAYNVLHATALFYQVITLNVAVNSYSNALLTLLMSNQFVEIKGTVFKKFEKENLFQLTCADVVERFQLWLMLLIIAMRNVVEVGGLSISLTSALGSSNTSSLGSNATGIPLSSTSILPKSFTILPKWTGEVLGPFMLVLGSEMLVDWLKHAYINKFNNTKPAIYGRYLDVMAKDYYSHAFVDQNLTKRLGLPVLPLACLFIRASLQTYHMFLATHMPLPQPSTATSLSVESAATTSPTTTAVLAHIDHIFRRALGRSTFGAGSDANSSVFSWWSLNDFIAIATMLVVFLVAYLVLLAFKLVLGMCLLSFARQRYTSMKDRERQVVNTVGKRMGGWGVVEVGEDKRRWIYADDPEGARALREREARTGGKEAKGEINLAGVNRYAMVAKRIWERSRYKHYVKPSSNG